MESWHIYSTHFLHPEMRRCGEETERHLRTTAGTAMSPEQRVADAYAAYVARVMTEGGAVPENATCELVACALDCAMMDSSEK